MLAISIKKKLPLDLKWIPEESFSKAISLNTRDPDPFTYNSWAYWKFEMGARNSSKLNFKKSIELNEKALEFSEKEDDIRRIKDFIASAYMKLGYITRIEAFKMIWKRKETFEEKDEYLKKAVDILEGNLINFPLNSYEIRHNLIDFNMLATAYLNLGDIKDKRREKFDTRAVYYLIQGLKLDPTETQLLYTLGHPGISKFLSKHNVRNPSDSVNIPKIIKLEQVIERILKYNN